MNQNDIINMAKECADEVTNGYGVVHYEFDLYSLEKFALLLTSTDREACAKEVAAIDADGWEFNMAAIIRERGAP